MKSENRFYVYVHRRKTDGSIFYVGKGTGYRCRVESKRSEYWNRVKNKYGFTHHFVKKNMNNSCAITLEKILIKMIGRENLCNHTDGGEGLLSPSEEVRRKMSIAKIGKVGPWKGKNRSRETKDKISIKLSGELHPRWGIKGELSPTYGRVQPQEERDKRSKASIGKKMPESFRNKLSKIKTGEGHHLYDTRKFLFINEDKGEEFVGTKYEFKIMTGFSQSSIWSLSMGRRKSKLMGWSCIKFKDCNEKDPS